MSDAPARDTTERPPPQPPRRGRFARRLALWAGGGVAGLLVLLAAASLLLDTGPGRHVAAGALGSLRLSNGLALHVGRIDGSIYGRMVLRDVVVTDIQGPFARSPAVVLDWRPFKLLSNHLEVEELSSDLVDVLRRPALKPAPPHPNEKLLPDQDVTLRRLRVGALALEPPVTGSPQRLTLAGGADIVQGRARLDVQARALRMGDLGGGDRIAVRLDAEPERNRLLLDAHAYGPADGAIAGLAKLRAPVSLDVAGQGTWRLWRGRVDARIGDRSLVAADLSESEGVYAARGEAVPELVVKDGLARLADPSLAFALTGSMKDRVVRLDGRLASPQMSLALAGGAGLADSTLRSLRVLLQLTRPEALSAQLAGSGVRANLLLDGPMARPQVDYDLAAKSLGFAGDRLEALKASGRVELGTGRHLQLVTHGQAARLVAPGKLDGVIRDIRLDGQLAGAWTGQARGRIDLRSSALVVGADISGDTRSGVYAADAKGRLDAAAVQALGLQSALGGPASFAVELARTPAVTAQVRSLQLTSPALKVTRAAGELRADGGLQLDARAVSAPYGPIALTAAGTLKSPTAHLTAAHPKVGVQLTNLDARLAKSGAVYRITATAGTPYGPLAAAAGVTPGPGPMTIDLGRASLAGLNLAGRLVRTPRGPFSGALTLTGDGLSGALRLSPAGALQQADALVRANQARLPLNPALTIAAGSLSARAVMTPGQPSVAARADLTNVRRGGFELTRLRADLDERNGAGRASIAAQGSARVPFDLASTVGMTPTAFTVDARGSANRMAFRLQQPARIVKTGGAWRLAPATLLLPSGRLDASGYYGRGAGLSLRLQQVDLSMTQGFAPQLGLGGLASGTVELAAPAGGGMPQGRAALKVASFTRSGLLTVSEPIDVSVAGGLGTAGADLGGVLRWRGVVVGRVQGRLTPAVGGASWMQRLQTGSLRGGLRYNGPSEALWALSGVSSQAVSGPIAIGADVSGRADAPQLRGVIQAKELRYQNATYGTRLDRLAIQGGFAGTRLQLTSLSGRAGSGSISGSGYADLSLARGLPMDLTLNLDRAQLARSDDLAATLSGRLRVTNSRQAGGLVAGALTLNNARYVVARQAATELTPLEGVHRKGQPLQAANETETALPISRWKLDVRVHALNQLFVAGMGLDSEWRADLRVTGDVNHPVAVGDITAVRGTYAFAGRDLQLTDGIIHLDGSDPPNPTLAITASSTVNEVTATINIAGSAQSPQITFASTPALPQDEVLSRLMFGAATPQLSPMQAVQLAASLNALRGHGGGLGPLGKLRQAVGVQNLTVSMGANGPGLGVGKYISNRVYLQVATDTKGLATTQIQVALSKTLSLLSQVGALGSSNLSVKYSRRY